MSASVSKTFKGALIKLTNNIPEELTKLVRKEFRDKFKGINEQEGVIIEVKGKERILLFSSDTVRLASAILDVCNYFQKNHIGYIISYSILVIVDIDSDSNLDAFDILGDIISINIKNASGILNLSNKIVIIHNNTDYRVDVEVKSSDSLQILIQKKYDDVSDLCNIFEELIGVYYNTLHLSLNE